jgi:nucleotidyltransferase/DNA polymerase involved in DNA repair
MDALIEQIEFERDLSRWIVHVDMDCFYAACEMRDDVRLRDVPMAVGGAAMLVSDSAQHIAHMYLLVNIELCSAQVWCARRYARFHRQKIVSTASNCTVQL